MAFSTPRLDHVVVDARGRMEEAARVYRSLGFHLHEQRDGRMTGFARGKAACEFRAPLRYLDEMEIHLLVERVGTSSLSYRFVFRRVEDRGTPCSPVTVAVGSLSVVSVARAAGDERLQATPLAPELAASLEAAPPELLQENS